MRFFNTGEALLEPHVWVGEAGGVKAHQVQDSGVQVTHMTALLDRLESQFIGGSDRLSPRDSRRRPASTARS